MRKVVNAMMYRNQIFGLVLGFALIAGCGSSDNQLQITTHNQVLDISGQSADCFAGAPSGQGLAGFDGGITSPLTCDVTFQTQSFFADFIQIEVTNVLEVYKQLGTVIPMGGGLVYAVVQLQGQTQPMLDGAVRFTEINNIAGERVAAEYWINTGITQIYGHFTASIASGYAQ
jgi:hypothetical protein